MVRNRIAPGLGVGAGLLHQAAQHQRAHHAVAVDAADRGNPGPAHRLPVGDHGQRLQRRLGEPDLLAVADEALHDRSALLPRVEAPAARHLAQVETAVLGGVGRRPAPSARPRSPRRGRSSTWASTTSGTGSSATSRIASRLARRPRLSAASAASPGSSSLAGRATGQRLLVVQVQASPERGPHSSSCIVFLVGCSSRSSGGAAVAVCPGHVEIAERRDLVQRDAAVPVELEHREEPRHDLVGARAVRRSAAGTWPGAAARSRPASISACSRTLVRGQCRCAVETTGGLRGASARAAIAANSAGPRPSSTSGSSSANRGSIGTRRGNLRGCAAIRPAQAPPRPPCTRGTAAAGRTAGPWPPAGRGPPRPRPRPQAAAGPP